MIYESIIVDSILLSKEKKDLESKKIYSIFICVGFIVFTISIFLLMK